MAFITMTDPDTGEAVEIEYHVSGSYYPQTLESPEEWPEFEIVTDLPPGIHESDVERYVLDCAESDEAEARAEEFALWERAEYY